MQTPRAYLDEEYASREAAREEAQKEEEKKTNHDGKEEEASKSKSGGEEELTKIYIVRYYVKSINIPLAIPAWNTRHASGVRSGSTSSSEELRPVYVHGASPVDVYVDTGSVEVVNTKHESGVVEVAQGERQVYSGEEDWLARLESKIRTETAYMNAAQALSKSNAGRETVTEWSPGVDLLKLVAESGAPRSGAEWAKVLIALDEAMIAHLVNTGNISPETLDEFRDMLARARDAYTRGDIEAASAIASSLYAAIRLHYTPTINDAEKIVGYMRKALAGKSLDDLVTTKAKIETELSKGLSYYVGKINKAIMESELPEWAKEGLTTLVNVGVAAGLMAGTALATAATGGAAAPSLAAASIVAHDIATQLANASRDPWLRDAYKQYFEAMKKACSNGVSVECITLSKPLLDMVAGIAAGKIASGALTSPEMLTRLASAAEKVGLTDIAENLRSAASVLGVAEKTPRTFSIENAYFDDNGDLVIVYRSTGEYTASRVQLPRSQVEELVALLGDRDKVVTLAQREPQLFTRLAGFVERLRSAGLSIRSLPRNVAEKILSLIRRGKEDEALNTLQNYYYKELVREAKEIRELGKEAAKIARNAAIYIRVEDMARNIARALRNMGYKFTENGVEKDLGGYTVRLSPDALVEGDGRVTINGKTYTMHVTGDGTLLLYDEEGNLVTELPDQVMSAIRQAYDTVVELAGKGLEPGDLRLLASLLRDPELLEEAYRGPVVYQSFASDRGTVTEWGSESASGTTVTRWNSGEYETIGVIRLKNVEPAQAYRIAEALNADRKALAELWRRAGGDPERFAQLFTRYVESQMGGLPPSQDMESQLRALAMAIYGALRSGREPIVIADRSGALVVAAPLTRLVPVYREVSVQVPVYVPVVVPVARSRLEKESVALRATSSKMLRPVYSVIDVPVEVDRGLVLVGGSQHRRRTPRLLVLDDSEMLRPVYLRAPSARPIYVAEELQGTHGRRVPASVHIWLSDVERLRPVYVTAHELRELTADVVAGETRPVREPLVIGLEGVQWGRVNILARPVYRVVYVPVSAGGEKPRPGSQRPAVSGAAPSTPYGVPVMGHGTAPSAAKALKALTEREKIVL